MVDALDADSSWAGRNDQVDRETAAPRQALHQRVAQLSQVEAVDEDGADLEEADGQPEG
nr:hypothetical protein [Friedmanniella luteola]